MEMGHVYHQNQLLVCSVLQTKQASTYLGRRLQVQTFMHQESVGESLRRSVIHMLPQVGNGTMKGSVTSTIGQIPLSLISPSHQTLLTTSGYTHERGERIGERVLGVSQERRRLAVILPPRNRQRSQGLVTQTVQWVPTVGVRVHELPGMHYDMLRRTVLVVLGGY